MSAPATLVETHHDDMIHDVQMDYYSRRFATCSSDRSIKIFDAEKAQLLATLTGHEGPVWGVQWAHPKFGNVLASCSYDRKIIVWKEVQANQWQKMYEMHDHESSVNALAFAPHEFGLVLACASSDGHVSVLTHQADDTWSVKMLRNAHEIGVNTVAWGPASPITGTLEGDATPTVRRLVTGGCDNLVKIWRYQDNDTWTEEATLEGHHDWVRDVAWAPNIGLPTQTIASCSEDHTVIIWSKDEGNPTWSHKVLHTFDAVVWRVSWSLTGNILAVSSGDNKVTLWKESLEGEWKCISSLSETGVTPLDTGA